MIYVIFPTYNEEGVIRQTLVSLAEAMGEAQTPHRAVLVDDGSTDATVAEAMKAKQECGDELDLEVVSHERNQGLGAALRTGILWCLDRARDEDTIVTLDADATHPAELIPEMAAKLSEGYDLVIASRYQTSSRVRGVPAHRLLISWLARFTFQLLFRFPGVRDFTCCFRAYRASALRQAQQVYGQEFLTRNGFEGVTDLLLRLRQLNVRAAEVPFTLEYGVRVRLSKMRVLRTIYTTLSLLGKRFVERFTRYTPARVRALLSSDPRPHGNSTP